MLRDWRWETVFHPTYTILDMSLWSCQCRSIWMVPKGKSKIFWQWLIQTNMNCLNYNNWIRSKSPLCWCVNTSWVFESGTVAGGNTCVLTQTSLRSLFHCSPSVPFLRLFKMHFQLLFPLYNPTLTTTTQHTVNKADVDCRDQIFQRKWGMWSSSVSIPCCQFWVSEHSPIVDNAILWFLWKSFLKKFKKVTV